MTIEEDQPQWLVRWEIDAWADTPEDAAREALAAIQRTDTIATVFEVIDEHGTSYRVDLHEGTSDRMTLIEAREKAGYGTLDDLMRERYPEYGKVRKERFK